jgi:hypothetical protein
MFDAWQNGGLYKGKPVTDDRLLGYIKSRRDGFSTDDPLWDEWNNRHTQYRFSIGEQKIGLAFKQGKVGAGAVAAFYRNELKSIPKDSAFYREVAGRATQWAKSVAGAARGRARASATKPLREKLNAQLEAQQGYLGLEAALTAYAKREGIISGNQDLSDADATELMDMFARGIYAGEDQITLDDFRTAAAGHYKALTSEIETRTALGQQSIEARNKRSRFLEGTLVRLNVVDERAQYEMARDTWTSALEDAQGNPYAQAAANDAYTRALVGIQANAARQEDPNAIDPDFQGGLVNELDALSGKSSGPTIAEMYGESGDAISTAESAVELQDNLKALQTDKAYFGQTEPGGEMSVVYWPAGQGPGSMGLDDSLQPSITRVNGQRRVVWLKGEAITASTIMNSITGLPLSPEEAASLSAADLRRGLAIGEFEYVTGENVGFRFVNPVNDDVKYGVIDPTTGNMMFTDQNPWESDPIAGLGGGLTIFTQATRNLGTTPTGRDRITPDIASLNPTVSIDMMDPLLSDSTVAPKDLLELIDKGYVTGMSEADLATYRQRLQVREQSRLTTLGNRDLGMTDAMGVGRQSRGTTGGGGDLRTSVLNGMNSVAKTTQSLFGSPSRTKDDLYVPPPPPPAPTPTATAAPITTKPKTTDSSPITQKVNDPYYQFNTTPSPTIDDSTGGATVGAGLWGAVNRYKEDQLKIGSGTALSGGR